MSTNLMTIQQVADLLGLSKQTLYKMVNQRRIPYVKVGRLLRFVLQTEATIPGTWIIRIVDEQ